MFPIFGVLLVLSLPILLVDCNNILNMLPSLVSWMFGLMLIEQILTGAGPLKVSVDAHGLISVEMGWPRVHTSLREEIKSLSGELHLTDDALDKVGCYSLGNPHLVTYDMGHFESRSRLGPIWESAPRDGVNVSFAEVVNQEAIKLHVYERGCGWTYGCGTGACAAVYHGYLNNLFNDGVTIDVELPGGHLKIEISARGLVMWGDAREVYRGELLTSPTGLSRDSSR